MKEDIVFFCEHDCLYPRDHYNYYPPTKDKFYYNTNSWRTRLIDDFSVYFDHQSLSGLCVYRELAIKEFRKIVAECEAGTYKGGYEPGTRDHRFGTWQSPTPYVDIRHANNYTESRWSTDRFRNKNTCLNWQEAYEIPVWGKISDIMKK
jgi:hypothetical protein